MARERIISSESIGHAEEALNVTLRPQTLDQVVGQRNVIERLKIAMDAARGRGEPLEHMLLSGPPGLGKTTLAFVIAQEMTDRPPRITSGPSLSKPADLMSVLTNLETGDILFIDECHRLPKVVEEFLYPAMEDFRVDFTIEGGMSGRVVNFALRHFTLIGATTRAGLLSGAMRDRFGHEYHLDFYDQPDLAEILRRSATKLDIHSKDGALEAIASRSRGTPRVANRLLRRVRDFAQVRAKGEFNCKVVDEALNIQQIDELGLDELDRAYLTTLIRTYNCGPAGVEALAASMGQERDTFEDVVEPYLLQMGFIIRTRQGRCATKSACTHLGLAFIPTKDATTRRGEDPSLFDDA